MIYWFISGLEWWNRKNLGGGRRSASRLRIRRKRNENETKTKRKRNNKQTKKNTFWFFQKAKNKINVEYEHTRRSLLFVFFVGFFFVNNREIVRFYRWKLRSINSKKNKTKQSQTILLRLKFFCLRNAPHARTTHSSIPFPFRFLWIRNNDCSNDQEISFFLRNENNQIFFLIPQKSIKNKKGKKTFALCRWPRAHICGPKMPLKRNWEDVSN